MCDGNCPLQSWEDDGGTVIKDSDGVEDSDGVGDIIAAIGKAAHALANELGDESDVETIRKMDDIVFEISNNAEYYNSRSAFDVLDHEPEVYEGPQDRNGYIAQAYDLAATRYWAEAYAPGCPPSQFFDC